MDKMIYLEIGKRVVLADPSCGVGFVTVHFNTEQYCNATADHRHKSKLCQVCLRKLHNTSWIFSQAPIYFRCSPECENLLLYYQLQWSDVSSGNSNGGHI